jgi:hypothetical protein
MEMRLDRRIVHVLLLGVLALFLPLTSMAIEPSLEDCRPRSDDPPSRTNILMVRKDGVAIDPITRKALDEEKTSLKEYDHYIDNMFEDVAKYCQGREKPCKLLLFFHGGLNTQASSVNRAARLTRRIKCDGVYPIFVNWNSSLPSTWWDHVAHIHKGLWLGNTTVAAVPYFIVADEVRSIVEAPTAWIAEARHTFPRNQEAGKSSLAIYQDMVRKHLENPEETIAVNDLRDIDKDLLLLDGRSTGERWRPRGKLLYSWATKLLAPPLLIQAAGTGAWDVMQRRTAMLFRTEAEFRGVSPEAVAAARGKSQEAVGEETMEIARRYSTGAALAYFISRYQDDFLPQFCKDGHYDPKKRSQDKTTEEAIPKSHEEGDLACEKRLELSLVGHSMGTIIVDRLLRYAPNLRVKNIVFMAAANTVEDYRDTVDSYLDRHKGDGDGKTQMYHLVLHPLTEVAEQGFLDLSPRGSLLIWIDNYFTDPPTPLGRRVGRFLNLLPELTFADETIRDQIHLKVFRVGRKDRCWNPQKHGDFGQFPFWDKRFWDPATPTDRTSPVRRLNGDGCPKEELKGL